LAGTLKLSSVENNLTNREKIINAKFKNLRRVFKARKLNLVGLNWR
jgi:hypothetical protein